MNRSDRRSDCPINFALQTFGDTWSLLVIRDLMFFEDRQTYTAFLQAGEGMATNVLAERLRRLRALGLIRKRGAGRGARYALTEKGLDLLPAMLQLIAWSARHDPRTAAPAPFVARIRADRDRLEAELRAALRLRYGLPEPSARRR